MNETTTPAPGIYRDRDGDAWAVTSDLRAVQLSQSGSAFPSSDIADQARHGLTEAASIARLFAPLTPLHIFEEVAK